MEFFRRGNMNDIIEKLKSLQKRTLVKNIHTKVLFLSVPRSGSTYLCDVISQLELLGIPDEWLNPAYIVELPKEVIDLQNSESIQNFVEFILYKTASSNGIFSLNLHLSSHEWWIRNGFNWIDIIGFDVIYFIYRKDKYAQAYSYALAHHKNKWRQKEKIMKVEPVEDLSFHQIFEFLATILNLEYSYEKNIKPMVHREFVYEDFSTQIEDTIKLIASDLNIHIDEIPKSNLQIQRKGYAQEPLSDFRSFMQSKIQNL